MITEMLDLVVSVDTVGDSSMAISKPSQPSLEKVLASLDEKSDSRGSPTTVLGVRDSPATTDGYDGDGSINNVHIRRDTVCDSSMVIPKPSQPSLEKVLASLDEKSDSRDNPTTVLEVRDSPATSNGDDGVDGVDGDDSINDVHIRRDSKKKRRASKLRNQQKERKEYVNPLPTIQEEEGEDDISSHIRHLSAPTSSSNEFIMEVQLLIDAASQRASQGKEEKAISIYKDGLRILRQGIKRILEQMEASATSKPKFKKTALFIILHEEWTEISLIIADIRKMMALIYERQEKYDKAICCCEEARALYEQSAIFDERHHKKGSSAHEKESLMEDMVKNMEEARESQYIRKSLHQTVTRIREKIVATSDEIVRRLLYEDMFDKLSTVLSLEVMYLGEIHPQIANTKGLLSVFYSEIRQNEKALRSINDAVLICEIALGDSHPRTGIKYQEAAKLYERVAGENNVVKAIDLYERAIATFERGEGKISERKCSILNSLGVLYIQRKNYDVAVKKLTDAIHIYEDNFVEETYNSSTDQVQVRLNLAECYGLQEELKLATNVARNALRIQRDKRKLYDTSAKDGRQIPGSISNSSIALTLKKLGKSYAAELKFDLACDSFLEALSILQTDFSTAQELVKFNPTIDLRQHQDEIACVLYHIAKVKLADKKYTEATTLYGESLHLSKTGDKNLKSEKRSNYLHCAMCLVGIGSIELILNQEGDAFKSFNQALFYIRKEGLPDFHPVVRMIWEKSHIAATGMYQEQYPEEVNEIGSIEGYRDTISRLEEKAEISKKTRDYKSCIKTIDVVVDMKRTVLWKLEEDKQNTENAKHQLAASLITMGKIELLTNSTEKTLECINEATDLLQNSGLDQNDKYFKQIEMTIHKMNQMKRRSETMGEF